MIPDFFETPYIYIYIYIYTHNIAQNSYPHIVPKVSHFHDHQIILQSIEPQAYKWDRRVIHRKQGI